MIQQNTYGYNRIGFYDGQIQMDRPKDIPTYRYQNLDDFDYASLAIEKVSENINLPFNCSQDSYYQCLAKKFASLQPNYSEVFGEKCILKKLCFPFSIPTADPKISLCDNAIDGECSLAFFRILGSQRGYSCQKLCHSYTFAYSTNVYKGTAQSKKEIQYFFKSDPEGSGLRRQKHRSMEPFKTVKREYLLMTTMSFIGNVGGTLGMFIGFSFVGTSEWLIDIVSKAWTWIREVNQAQKSRLSDS